MIAVALAAADNELERVVGDVERVTRVELQHREGRHILAISSRPSESALRADSRGLELRDLGSTNGTFFGDAEVIRGYVRSGSRIRIGQSTLSVTILDREIEQPLAVGDRMGDLIGGSAAMRRLYPLLEQ